MSFPDVEAILVGLVEPYVGEGHAGTVVDVDLQSKLPYAWIQAGTGIDNHFQRRTNARLMVFTADRSGLALAEDITEYLTTLRHHPLDRVTTQSAPQETPWAGDGVRLWTTAFEVVVRRR